MANRMAVIRRSLANFIMLSAPWKTTWRGPTKLGVFSVIFYFIVVASMLTRTEIVGMQLKNARNATNSTVTSPANLTLNSTPAAPADFPTKERNLCQDDHAPLLDIPLFFDVVVEVVMGLHLTAIVLLARQAQYDLITGDVMFPEAVPGRIRLCRWTIAVSGGFYFCSIVSSYIILYECDAIGWPVMMCQFLVDNPVIGGFTYLILWWFAMSGPQRLN